MDKNEQETLKNLNKRLEEVLDKIADLAEENRILKDKIVEAGSKQNSSDVYRKISDDFCRLSKEINEKFQQNIQVDLEEKRAESERKFFQKQIQIDLTENDEEKRRVQQLERSVQMQNFELEQWKKQTEHQIEQNQMCEELYRSSIEKLNETKGELEFLICENSQIERRISNLQEMLIFERVCRQKRQEEIGLFEKTHNEFFLKFQFDEKTEILEKIREDYRKFNEIQLEQFESTFRSKVEFFHDGKTEENFRLEKQIVELEEELKKIVEQNKSEIDKLNEQFENLKINLPSYESLLSNSKESNVHLYSEIQTYQSLLSNVWSDCRVEQRSAFQVFRNDQFIWIRI